MIYTGTFLMPKGMRNGPEKSKLVRDYVEGNGYTLLNEYIDGKTVLQLICPNGHSRTAKIHNFRLHGCPECSGNNVLKTIEDAQEVFNSRGFTLLETEYVNCKTHMKHICNCGEIRYTTLDVLMHSKEDSCHTCKKWKVSGSLAPNWRGGITPENKLMRSGPEAREWRLAVFRRDGYTCRRCQGANGGDLRGHHVLNWATRKDLRFDVDNGVTLCEYCHDIKYPGSFHATYGAYENTREQLEEYIQDYDVK